MAPIRTEGFVATAEATGASVTRVADGEFGATLEAVVAEPAVGTALPFDGIDYAGTSVESSPTGAAVAAAETGVTAARLGIADYGSVLLAETGAGEELLSLYPSVHVVVLAESDVVGEMPDAIASVERGVADGETSAIVATGPSATADMGAVVTGVHGPRDVHVLLLEDR